MRKTILFALLTALIAPAAQADVYSFGGVTPDVIYGSGNTNDYWGIYTENGIELGMRARVRGEDTYNVTLAQTYIHEAGSPDGTAATWDFDFAANVGTRNLENTRIDLWIDLDPTTGVNYFELEDIFTHFSDNEVGTAATGSGGGLEYSAETGGTTLADYTVVQNSLNLGELGLVFDPYVSGTYDFLLHASNISNPSNEFKIDTAWMQVEVVAVPEPATIVILLQLAALSIAIGRNRRRNR